MKTRILLIIFIVTSLAGSVRTEAAELTGTVSEVTIYRGQALVTRHLETELKPGINELVVTALPNRIISDSLYAHSSGNATVLSVRYREQAVKEDTRQQVREIEQQIEQTEREIYHATRNREYARNLWDNYQQYWKLAINTVNADFNRALLKPEAIEALTNYLQSKMNQIHNQCLELEDKKAELEKQLELLKRKRGQLDAGHSRTKRQAVLFVNSSRKQSTEIELNYLVSGATWHPQYNLRANQKEEKVLIEYNAVVNQACGENWSNVKMNLSTAQPSMVAAAPTLEPFKVSLASARQPGQQTRQFGLDLEQPAAAMQQLEQSRMKTAAKGGAAQEELERIAGTRQLMFLNVSGRELKKIQSQTEKTNRIEGVSVTYELEGEFTLPSRSDQHLLSIASLQAPAEFTLLANPVLTDYVYLQAQIRNDSDMVLLPGAASMFRDNQFAGNARMPMVTIGEKFTTGFGIDSQIQVARHLEDKQTRIQGGNRIDTYDYAITLSNYRDSAVKLRLLDRIPYSDNSSVRVELDKVEPALSDNSEYLENLRPKGILRWDLTLEPDSIEQTAKTVKYSFTMEYDRNMNISLAD